MTSRLLNAALGLTLLVCTAAMAGGFWKVWKYEQTPGQRADTQRTAWPATCPLERISTLPTLIVAVHPNCPCSRATLEELAQMVADFRGKMLVYVLFERPKGLTQDPATTDLWKSASEIPMVRCVADDRQWAVSCFGARTSGQVFLFDANGRQCFEGGITPGRGHAGDNDGRAAIEIFLKSGTMPICHTPVFGCALSSN